MSGGRRHWHASTLTTLNKDAWMKRSGGLCMTSKIECTRQPTHHSCESPSHAQRALSSPNLSLLFSSPRLGDKLSVLFRTQLSQLLTARQGVGWVRREWVSGRYRIGMDGLDGDKLNHTSGCKGQHTLADFSPMHGAYSPIWRAEATENPSLDDGPESRAGMRYPKKERPQLHPLCLEP